MVTKKAKNNRLNISQAQELKILRKIVEITNSELDLSVVLKEVVGVMTEATKADSVFIYLFDDKKKNLFLMASKTPHKKELGKVNLKAGEGITGWVARENKPVAIKANEVTAGAIRVRGLRLAVAFGVALGITLGAWRIVVGLPIHWFIIAGYVIVVIQTRFAPKIIIPLAYDSGGVTTSTVTVPLVAALGIGLAENVPGRSPLIDGFGLIAFASVFPIMTVMAYAQLAELKQWLISRRRSPTPQDPDSIEEITHAIQDNRRAGE